MDAARFLTTGRTTPRFGEGTSCNRQQGLDFGNLLDLKTSECKLKHVLGEAPRGYCLKEGNISSHFIYDYGLYASTQSAQEPAQGVNIGLISNIYRHPHHVGLRNP
jgi:hypothetical protein